MVVNITVCVIILCIVYCLVFARTAVYCKRVNVRHTYTTAWLLKELNLSKLQTVSLIHILVFHLLTTLHKSDPHCHHHLSHHQSLFLFFTLDLKLKHTSSWSLSTLDFTIDTHWTDPRTPGRTVFLLLIGFVLVFSSRISAVA